MNKPPQDIRRGPRICARGYHQCFTAYAARGNDTLALLTATSNNTGVIPNALAFVAFFANNYDKIFLRPT